MALSKKIEETGANVAPKTDAVAKKDNSTSDAFRQEGAKLRELMTEDEKAVEGSKSDKIAFVAALGNPARKQDRVEGGKSIPCYEVVGYKFKALEDTVVPVMPLKSADPLNVDAMSETTVKAGEVFSLNIMEMAMLISKVEYAGKFTGEGDGVVLSAKSSKTRTTPLPILKKASASGSIKSNIELIADMVGDANNGKGTPKVKPEFEEKFGVIFVKKSAGKKGLGKTVKTGESAADLAAAFRKHLQASK